MCIPPVAAIIASIALAGCSAASMPAEPVSDARVSSDTWLVMTDRGVGPITSGSAYETEAMAAIVPGAQIRTVDAATEAGSTRAPAAFVNGQQAVQFFKGDDGRVGQIHGISQHLAGPNGERIGMTLAQTGVRRDDCRVGRAEWRGMAVCTARGTRQITLVFSIPEFDGPFETLPTDEELTRAELQRMVWRAEV